MTANRLSGPARGLLALAAICTAALAVSFILQFPRIGIDDANIFFVYARSVSAGDGFVFNPGGERVEGFTSLLWVLICSGAVSVASAPEHVLLAVNLVLVALTISNCLHSPVLRDLRNPAALSIRWGGAFVIVLLSDPRYVAWNTIALMDTALWSCLITLSALVVADGSADRRRSWTLACLIALMIATRPEALLWAAAVLVLFYIRLAIESGNRTFALRRAIPGVIAYALTAGALTVFRLMYFGFPFPNTYYAKVSPSLVFSLREGAHYLWSYISSGPVPLACLLALLPSVYHLVKVKFRDTRTLVLTGLAAAGFLLPVPTGGDHFGGFRFYQPVYPILLLAGFNCIRFILPRYVTLPGRLRTRRVVLLVGGSLLTAALLIAPIVRWMKIERMPLRMEFNIAELGRERGREANELFQGLDRVPSIGTITVGGLKYAYVGDVIDLMGLNGTRMAHNGGDRIGFRSHAAFEKRTFYEVNPTMVIPLVQYSDLSWLTRRSVFVDNVLKGLLDDRQFHAKYRLAEVRKTVPNGVVAVAAWYDREFLDRLVQTKNFQILVPAEP